MCFCKDFDALLKELEKTFPRPGDLPRLPGIEIAGGVISQNGRIGGDHITYVDFNARYNLAERIKQASDPAVRKNLERNQKRAGVLLADVSGHDIATAVIAGQLHQAFLLGVRYELDKFGEITPNLFEELNGRFFQTSARGDLKFITLLYGEIKQSGKFRFISAGHEYPLIFSFTRNTFVDIQTDEICSTQPIGILPSRSDIDDREVSESSSYKNTFVINERKMLAVGDILLLYTDGLVSHENERGFSYFRRRLESVLQSVKHMPAQEIFEWLKRDIWKYGPLHDDVSLVIIKRT